jgi:hypothetical protein
MLVKDFRKELDIWKACRKSDDPDVDDTVSQLIENPLQSMEDIESFNDLLSDRQKFKKVVSDLMLAFQLGEKSLFLPL